jgi:hypothetical protein
MDIDNNLQVAVYNSSPKKRVSSISPSPERNEDPSPQRNKSKLSKIE